MNKLTAFLATWFTAVAVLVSPAMAHSVLKKSIPEGGSSVAAPSFLELTFSDSVNLRFSKVTLTGPLAVAAEIGEPAISADGHTLAVPVSAPLSPGKYVVNWDALSQDGHKVNGMFSFVVE